MGKHKRWDDWENKTPEEKADSFDRQYADSAARAEEKRENGEYPYDLDKKVEKK